jgi:hypothetical protein
VARFRLVVFPADDFERDFVVAFLAVAFLELAFLDVAFLFEVAFAFVFVLVFVLVFVFDEAFRARDVADVRADEAFFRVLDAALLPAADVFFLRDVAFFRPADAAFFPADVTFLRAEEVLPVDRRPVLLESSLPEPLSPISFFATPTAAGIATPSAVPATIFWGVVSPPSSSSRAMVHLLAPASARSISRLRTPR